MTTAPALAARLAELVEFARAGGASPAWLTETSDELVGAVLELADHRLNASDPRRAATLAEAAQLGHIVASCRRAGYSERDALDTARKRLRLRRTKFFRLVALSREIAERSSVSMAAQRRPAEEHR